MILYYLNIPVETCGPCEDGWVWGVTNEKGAIGRGAWYWMMQLHRVAPRRVDKP